MATRPKQDLTTGPIGPALIIFAVPTLLSSILQSLQGSINAIWVGRFLGESALAATSNTNLILFLILSFVFGFGMAATVMMGQAFGRKDIDQARRVIGTMLGGLFFAAIPLAVLGWVFTPQLLHLLALGGAAQPLALAYLRVIFISVPGVMLLVVLLMGLRGSGDAMTPLWVMIGGAVIDCGLNPLLILGVGPFPRMGIAGSATSTVIANLICLIGAIIVIYRRDLPIRLRGPELRYLIPDLTLIRRVLAMGLPMGLQMIVLSLAGIAMLGLVNREGVDTTAAYGVALQLWTYVQMPAMALSAAASAMSAQNIGAGRWDRVGQIARLGVLFNLALTGVLVLLLAVADRPALALFLGPDSPALPIAQHIQIIATWSFILAGVTVVLLGTVRANGAVWGPLVIFAISLFAVRLVFAVTMHPSLGADAIWYSYPLGSLASLVLAWAFYRWGGWRKPRAQFGPRPTPLEAAEETLAGTEPEGRMTPTG